MSRGSPCIERLECRRLLASPFSVKINFQPESSPEVPAGFRADIGRIWAPRANGLHYGWKTNNEDEARDRNAANAPDQRYDTLNHLTTSGRWAIVVPNGWYHVRLVAGDPSYSNSDFKIDVEGERAIDGAPSANWPWMEGNVVVEVRDNGLTITSAAGAVNNKLAFVEINGFRKAPAPPSAQWSSGAVPAAISRVDAGIIQVGTKLYMFGGYRRADFRVTDRTDIFDLETSTWISGAPLPDGAPQTHAGLATDGQYIYMVAGQVGPAYSVGTDRSWRYDTLSDTWSEYVALPEVRYGGALAFFNGNLYFFGGAKSDRVTTATEHWVLNTRSKNPSWVSRAALPLGGDHLSRAVIGGKIYAIGGEHGHADRQGNGSYSPHNYLFEYDPLLDHWTRKADLPVATSHMEGSTLAVGTKIFVAGGLVQGEQSTADCWVYDTLSDDWTLAGTLPDLRSSPAAAILDNRVYFTAGFSPVGGITGESYWGLLEKF